MNGKKIYEAPVLDVVYFAVEDIMSTSNGNGGIELPDHKWN